MVTFARVFVEAHLAHPGLTSPILSAQNLAGGAKALASPADSHNEPELHSLFRSRFKDSELLMGWGLEDRRIPVRRYSRSGS